MTTRTSVAWFNTLPFSTFSVSVARNTAAPTPPNATSADVTVGALDGPVRPSVNAALTYAWLQQ